MLFGRSCAGERHAKFPGFLWGLWKAVTLHKVWLSADDNDDRWDLGQGWRILKPWGSRCSCSSTEECFCMWHVILRVLLPQVIKESLTNGVLSQTQCYRQHSGAVVSARASQLQCPWFNLQGSFCVEFACSPPLAAPVFSTNKKMHNRPGTTDGN